MHNPSSAPGAGRRMVDEATAIAEGAAYAAEFLDRLRQGKAQPGELALILSFLSGDMLHGACRVIEKAVIRHE